MRCTYSRFHRSASGRVSKDSAAASHHPAALCRAGIPFTAPVHRVFRLCMLRSISGYKKACHLLYSRDDRLFTFAVPLLLLLFCRKTESEKPLNSLLRWLTVAVYSPVCTYRPGLRIRHFHCSASRRAAGSFGCVAPSRSSLISRTPTVPVHCVSHIHL